MTISNLTLTQCQQALQYQFANPELLKQALTHASTASDRLDSNERLEFLGDAILGMVICHELYRRFPSYLEGELTKVKSNIVSRKTCARVAESVGLHVFLEVGKGMIVQKRIPQSCSSAAFEAIVGAIYLDGGEKAAWDFIVRTVGPFLDEADAQQHQENFKSILQQYAQKEYDATPVYEVLDEKGPDHSKCFEVSVILADRRFNSAWGPSKKEAEQLAAFNALCELGMLSRQPGDASQSQ